MSALKEAIEYIKEDGEFSDCEPQIELANKADIELAAMLKKIKRLENAIKWALGEKGNFLQRKDKQGAYYWRTELRKRAFPKGK